jgi:hypothetical protein
LGSAGTCSTKHPLVRSTSTRPKRRRMPCELPPQLQTTHALESASQFSRLVG